MKKQKHKILIITIGKSPQVLTETLYVMAIDKKLAVPDEIYVLTTKDGAKKSRQKLMSKTGEVAKLCDEYNLPKIKFTNKNIITIKDANNLPMEDIRTEDDNQQTADQITNFMRVICQDDNNQLFVCLSGGRKTFSYYMGMAMTLFGREQDVLSHVLVDKDYEFVADFFYPTKQAKWLKNNNGKKINCQDAKITLSQIPYIRLREILTAPIINKNLNFTETVTDAQNKVLGNLLHINKKQRTVRLKHYTCKLSPVLFSFYLWIITNQKNNKTGTICPPHHTYSQKHAAEFLKIYQEVKGKYFDTDTTKNGLVDGMDNAFFMEKKSRIKKELTKTFGIKARHIWIKNIGIRNACNYQVPLSNDQIIIE
ncbi:MAG: TIGR02584 family CRISPR-associated protein [Gammaproteobacteria bacterium]|nr:MAG: TIGR02584 family CRISPR-associated protein [Gammaproteobacteria bacterium]